MLHAEAMPIGDDVGYDDMLQLLKDGRYLLVQGMAGTGKSHMVRGKLARAFQELYGPDCNTDGTVLRCAPTGVAANAIDGTTYHKALGLGMANGDLQHIVETVQGPRHAMLKRRLSKCRMLVVDEVGLVGDRIMDLMHGMVALLRDRPNEAWGGLQLVFICDVLQLGPIAEIKDVGARRQDVDSFWKAECMKGPDGLLSPNWVTCRMPFVSHRCTDEEHFRGLCFVSVRRQCEPLPLWVERWLHNMSCNSLLRQDGQATHIFGRNDKCLEYNCSMLNKLPGKQYDYFAVDNSSSLRVGRKASNREDERDPAMPFLEKVSLKVGTLVVLAKGVVGNNGPIHTGTTAKVVRFIVDAKISDLQWVGDPQLDWSGHAKHAFVKQAIVNVNSLCMWPVVSASIGDLVTEAVLKPMLFTVETTDAVPVNNRIQIPCAVRYALTSHRAQSMSLAKTVVDVSDMWVAGQVYSALARTPTAVDTHVLTGKKAYAAMHACPYALQFLQTYKWRVLKL